MKEAARNQEESTRAWAKACRTKVDAAGQVQVARDLIPRAGVHDGDRLDGLDRGGMQGAGKKHHPKAREGRRRRGDRFQPRNAQVA